MSEFTVHLRLGSWGSSRDRVRWARGTAFIGGDKYTGTALAEALPLPHESAAAWERALLSLNGFFAIVAYDGRQLVAAVDRVRSVPLFYATKDNTLVLSDDAEWVRREVGDSAMDSVAREEFQLTGYVTGEDTLYPSVKQLQAGEMIFGSLWNGRLKIERRRYYRFVHTEPDAYDEPCLRRELASAVERAIQRLVAYANGRQIVVPLSGGFDSRLIVMLLHRMGYSRVLAFTYGVPGNRESEYSRLVAEALGIRWHFVEYTQEKWRLAWRTNERLAYERFACQHVSLPHVQDWLAVWEMTESGVLDTGCVFAPGHSGDFVAGSHIPEAAWVHGPKSIADLCREVLNKHYNLAPMTSVSRRSKEVWCDRIRNRAEAVDVKDSVQLADAFEKWDWQERQAKFIINSVRVYEFWGYDWWLPLWDAEFVDFWTKVPLSLRVRRHWYAGFVQSLGGFMRDQGGASPRRPLGNAVEDDRVWRVLKRIGRRLLPGCIYNAVKSVVHTRYGHPLLLHAAFEDDLYRRLSREGYVYNGVLAWEYLNKVATSSCDQETLLDL